MEIHIFLQDTIDKLVKWSEKWQMLFDFWKCKCLHTEHGNTGMNYKMGGTILSKTVKEKDLGVTMNANMKVSEQCRMAASKGNQVIGMIRRNITYKEKSLIVPLYKAIVRPHLQYCIQAWSLSAFGHICRLQPGTQAIDILASTPPSTWRRPRGRPPLRWADQIVKDTQMSLSDAVTATQDRSSWRSLVRDATRPATQAT